MVLEVGEEKEGDGKMEDRVYLDSGVHCFAQVVAISQSTGHGDPVLDLG